MFCAENMKNDHHLGAYMLKMKYNYRKRKKAMDITWDKLECAVKTCHACRLCEGRTNTVVGDGNKNAAIMLVGEGPGRDEDMSGTPFVGAAGKLLDRMLASIGLDRTNVYIANIVKCRPPNNRTPLDDEAKACIGYLRAQFLLVRPKIIFCLGSTAARHIIDPEFRITREHGFWHERKGIYISSTYHPAALLRDESKKREAFEDLKSLREKIAELELL